MSENGKARVVEKAKVLMGQSPPSSACSENGDGLPFIQGNAEFGKRNPFPRLRCFAPTRIAEACDLLLSVRAPVGELNQALERIVIGRGLSALRFEPVEQGFAWHAIKYAVPALTRVAQGSTFVAVSREDVERLQIPWHGEANLRIAAVLDMVDEAISKTEAVIAKLRQVRAGLLHDLLTRGLDKNGQLRDPIAHPEQFQDSPLGQIPKEWEVVPLKVKCETYSGGTPSRSSLEFFGGAIPWVKSGEVNQETITETEESLTNEGLASSNAKWISEGTPLIAMYGATAGQVSWLAIRATANQAVLAIVPRSAETVARFIFWAVRYSAQRVVVLATGSGQPNLSKGMIGAMLLALPTDAAEQYAITERIDGVIASERSENSYLGKLVHLKSGLMTDLLTGRVRVPENLGTTS